MTPISLVIITLNEEKNIERCIRSVPFARDIVIVDSGSSDNTVAIARRLGARILIENWRGYYRQKVRATAMALNPWVLSLDADEALSPELQKELEALLLKPMNYEAYEFKRLSYHMGEWIYHGGWYPDAQARLFNKEKVGWQESHVHERVKAEKVLRLKNPMHHWVFNDLAHQVDTNNKYSSLGTKDLIEKQKKFSIIKLLLNPVSKFLETYVIKRGFLDGMPGFIISVGAAYSVFLKFAKLWEYEKSHKKSS